ncbi:MAG: hypothetical protein GWP23_07640 [Synechococcales cyanobacterium H12SWP_bin.12]|nr:hypothetical protein [Synechococcales cyanobacterium H12SWP_bin.12]
MKTAPKIDPETIKNSVGDWKLFFVGLEEWKMEAWGVAGRAPGTIIRGVRGFGGGF